MVNLTNVSGGYPAIFSAVRQGLPAKVRGGAPNYLEVSWFRPIELLRIEQKWSYDAINATITSLRQAFHEGLFPTFRDIFVLPEPEACALFTVDDLLRKNHHVLIPV